ncbi:MAG: hypothetical protein IKB20_00965 [Clostridia bacterium]|nr:hypothetical protein [Clostridia bacterium]
MSNLYEEYGLEQEKELGAEPKLPTNKPKKVKKSGGWAGRIIAFFLGIIIALGSCAGVVFALISQPVRKLTGFAGMDFETQVKDTILSEEYGDKTLLQLSQDALFAAMAKDLAGLDKVFPMVGVYIGELADKMHTQFGVHLDAQEMMETHMDMLPEYIGGKFKATALGELLEATKGGKLDPLLMEICYGEEGKDYQIDENGEIVMMDGKQAVTVQMLSSDSTSIIDKVSLSSVVHPKADDAIMLEVAYGKEGVTFELETDESGTVLVDEHGGAIVKMLPYFLNKNEGGEFVDYNGNPVACTATEAENGYTKIEEYFPDTTDVKDTYYVKDDGNGNFYARAEANDEAEELLFHKVTIGDMSTDSNSIIDNIYLKDALGIKFQSGQDDPHGVLMSLAYGKKGIDYVITGEGENREIQMINGSTCRTIGDLRKRSTNLINDIELAEIMKEDREDAIIMYLLYGKEDLHYEIDSLTNEIKMKKQRIAIVDEDHIYNEYEEQYQKKDEALGHKGYVIDLTAGTYIDVDGNEYTIEETTDTLTVQTGSGPQTATWYYLKQNGEYTYYSKSSLGDLTGSVNLASTLTDRMTVGEIFGEEADNNFFLKHLTDSTITGLPTAISNLTVGNVFEAEIAENPGMWKYLLKEGANAEAGKNYKVAEHINKLLDNMTANISTAPLSQLSTDGVITLDTNAQTALDTDLKDKIGTTPIETFGKAKLGDLTASELLIYISSILPFVS